MARGKAAMTENEWSAFVRAFRTEMKAPTSRRTLDLLAERGALLSEPALAAQKPRGPEFVPLELMLNR
jgi:hypothetical protein